MSNTLIQILRSNTTSQPGSLANGQLAYTSNGNVLYIGSPDGTVTPIGGKYFPGTLTANQALVANSTSGINNINATTLTLVANTTTSGTLSANGSQGTAGYILFSGGPTANAYWGAQSFSAYQLNSTLAANVATMTANNSNFLGTIAAASYQLNSTLSANVITLTSNNSNYLGAVAAASYLQNTDSRTLSGNLVFGGTNTYHTSNVQFWGANVCIVGTNTSISSNVTISSANITATSATLSILNLAVSGNLVVTGTTTTINTTQLAVSDNVIQLGDNNLTTDAVDLGFFAPAGNSTVTWYSGFGRVASKSTNSNPYFVAFATKTNPNSAPVFDLTAANSSYGTIQAYLSPYGPGGGFIANSTVLNITANSTFSSAIVANTLTLSTALGATSGGTGILGASYAAGDILFAATAAPTALSRLTAAANGNVLQIVNNLPSWSGIDCGSF